MTPPLCPPTPTRHTPRPQTRIPRIISFSLQGMAVEMPSTSSHRTYCVAFEGAKPATCSCMGHMSHGHCKHTALASDWLFSTEGLWETLEKVDEQLALVARSGTSISCYQLASLQAVKDELEKRLGLEQDVEPDEDFSPPISFCTCGSKIPGLGYQAFCVKCKCTVEEAWQLRMVRLIPGATGQAGVYLT